MKNHTNGISKEMDTKTPKDVQEIFNGGKKSRLTKYFFHPVIREQESTNTKMD